jgi:MoaA/NifB/PqqE/SkfB family radical SAM enzyme
MCSIPSLESSEELDLHQMQTIFLQLKDLDAVRITGGEPFIRRDLPDVVNVVLRNAHPRRVIISTNAFLGDRIIDTIKNVDSPHSIHLEISLDGIGDEHDNIRGRRGAFQGAMNTLQRISELRMRQGFNVNVSQVIMDEKGFTTYFALQALLDPLGIDIYPVLAYNGNTALYSEKNRITDPADAYLYNAHFKEKLRDFLFTLMRKDSYRERGTWLAKRYYLMGIYHRLIKGVNMPNPRCVALHSHLRINPDGTIPVCMHNSHVMGDLTANDFDDVWFGKEIKPHREWVNTCPGCWVGCEIIPSGIYTGDILRAFRIRDIGKYFL